MGEGLGWDGLGAGVAQRPMASARMVSSGGWRSGPGDKLGPRCGRKEAEPDPQAGDGGCLGGPVSRAAVRRLVVGRLAGYLHWAILTAKVLRAR